jgi:hypothetical protein
MKMVRKQIYLEKKQDEKVKRLARDLGVTEAEVLRRSIDNFEPSVITEEERRAAGMKLIEMLKQRLIDHPVGTVDKFDREELYAERLGRLSR